MGPFVPWLTQSGSGRLDFSLQVSDIWSLFLLSFTRTEREGYIVEKGVMCFSQLQLKTPDLKTLQSPLVHEFPGE